MRKFWILLALVICVLAGYWAYPYVKLYFLGQGNNLTLHEDEKSYVYIKTGSSTADIASMLEKEDIIKDREEFIKLAQAKNYSGDNIVPGKYQINGSMNNNAFINHLRAGNGRLSVQVTFSDCVFLKDIAEQVAPDLEVKKQVLIKAMKSSKIHQKYGFSNQAGFKTMFLPNTYEFYWDTDASEFIARMAEAYKKFWNAQRKAKASKLNLTQSEVSTLASIVIAEQRRHSDEWPRIAGLYINRLKNNIPLESDPTLIYATGDFSIRRVYNRHKKIKSPYNTYKNRGLPPGPIRIPTPQAISAVLNYEIHDYIFMCAQPGYESYHNFAATNAEHNRNVAKYRQWQRKEGIR